LGNNSGKRRSEHGRRTDTSKIRGDEYNPPIQREKGEGGEERQFRQPREGSMFSDGPYGKRKKREVCCSTSDAEGERIRLMPRKRAARHVTSTRGTDLFLIYEKKEGPVDFQRGKKKRVWATTGSQGTRCRALTDSAGGGGEKAPVFSVFYARRKRRKQTNHQKVEPQF